MADLTLQNHALPSETSLKERILSKVGGSLKVKLPGKEGMALMAVKRENDQVKHH